MSLLPGRIVPSTWLLVSGFFVLIFSFFLFTFSIAPSAQAAPGESPNPQPCKNVEAGPLTDNWITDENGNPPISQPLPATGALGDQVTVTLDTSFTVDFSKLQAIFGTTNSNYLEGRFQDQSHQTANIISLKSSEFNTYHGPGQKAAPKVMTDGLKVEYVNYVYNKPELAESVNKYTDINGQNPKTIYELVNIYKLPDLKPDTADPTPPSWGGDKDVWQNGWAKYWEKIPTAYSEFYEGELQFRLAAGQESFAKIENGEICPLPIRTIKFVMPDFFRTTAISGQLNQVVVPKAAQSIENNNLILRVAESTKTTLAKVLENCFQAITQNPLSKTLRKVIKVTFNYQIPQVIKNAYAAADSPCFKIIAQGKEGTAQYCALPAGELQPGDSCTNPNPNDPNKLDKDNPNVKCTFRIFWQTTLTFGDADTNPRGDFDSCIDTDDDGIDDTCTIEVRVWPVFRIPWLAEIWNNSLYSDTEPGIVSTQKTGRPGVYSFFTPGAIYSKLFPSKYDRALDLLTRCYPNWPDQTTGDQVACAQLNAMGNIVPCAAQEDIKKVAECLSGKIGKNLPGQVADNVKGVSTNVLGTTSSGAKERFVGATDCSKEFTRDVALKPKALQDALGIDELCSLQVRAGPPGASPPPPGSGGDLDYYIEYGNTSILPAMSEAELRDVAAGFGIPNNFDAPCPGVNSCYQYVIQQSISHGINPAFAIAVWWEEGGFGGAQALDEFGQVAACAQHDFLSSFTCFLNGSGANPQIPASYFLGAPHPYDPADPAGSFANWVFNYMCGDPTCSNNLNFLNNLESIYTQVSGGVGIHSI